MNFRVNLAVAFAAALSFACADKQAAIPELEEAFKAPPGQTVVGVYSMEVTPVDGPGGLEFSMQAIPVGKDGSPTTNPNGTLQVFGTFGAVTTAGSGGCAGQQALTANVDITNFSVDNLTNVWVDVTTTMGTTGTLACNSTTNILANGMGLVEADRADGLWKYPDLAGAPNSVGTVAGGVGTANWGFLFNNATAFRFYFKVMANVNEPAVDGGLTVGPTLPITWRSSGAKSTILQICATNPGGTAACATPLLNQQYTSASVAAPYTFSVLPPALTNGVTYFARATNVFAGGVSKFSSPWVAFTYSTVGAAIATNQPVPANVTAGVNGFAAINWTTPDDGNFLQYTYVVMCRGACPASAPGARPVLNNANILYDGPVSTTLINGANAEYSLFLPTDLFQALTPDLVTGVYLDTAAVYDFRVYTYDGFSAAPAFSAPHVGGTNIVTVTAVQQAPSFTPPVSYLAANASWPLAVTADPGFANVLVQVCVPNCVADAPNPINGANSVTPAGGISFPLTAGAGTIDFKTIPGIAALPATSTFEFLVFNPDLYQIYPTVPTAVTVQ